MNEILDAVGTKGLAIVLSILLIWAGVKLIMYLLDKLEIAHSMNANNIKEVTTALHKTAESNIQVAKALDHFRQSNEECQRAHHEMLAYMKGRDGVALRETKDY
jgi:hypothetical protein